MSVALAAGGSGAGRQSVRAARLRRSRKQSHYRRRSAMPVPPARAQKASPATAAPRTRASFASYSLRSGSLLSVELARFR